MTYNGTIMPHNSQSINRIREQRTQLGLTQSQLAERAGISRTAVTAIEGNRLVPSVAAALALSEALSTTVERLFGGRDPLSKTVAWASQPTDDSRRFWEAEVGQQRWRFPADSTPLMTPLPDGFGDKLGTRTAERTATAIQTLVIACCDPAVGFLASTFEQMTGMRMLVLHRSSRQAISLLKEGKVHIAGLHLSTPDEPNRNADTVRESIGADCQLLRIATWQEGVATASSSRIRSVRGAVNSKLSWVGREPGSGARQCLDRLFAGRPSPRRVARNHRAVAEAIRSGWADAGVCVQLTSIEAGLKFIAVQAEAYDLCIPNRFMDDPRVKALLRVIRSTNYRSLIDSLPGYDSSATGSLTGVN